MLKKLLLTGAAAALLVSQADPAEALAIRVNYNSGAILYTVDDNEATAGETDSSAIVGHIQHNRQVGDFALGTASSLSSQAFGSVNFAALGTSLHAVRNFTADGGTVTLEILASEVGFTAPDADTFWSVVSDFGISTFGDSYLIETYIDFGNGLFNTSAANLLHSGTQSTPNVEDPVNFIIPDNLTAHPFSITHRIVATHTAAATETQINNRTTITTPEPEMAVLFGLGLLGLAYAGRRRKS